MIEPSPPRLRCISQDRDMELELTYYCLECDKEVSIIECAHTGSEEV